MKMQIYFRDEDYHVFYSGLLFEWLHDSAAHYTFKPMDVSYDGYSAVMRVSWD